MSTYCWLVLLENRNNRGSIKSTIIKWNPISFDILLWISVISGFFWSFVKTCFVVLELLFLVRSCKMLSFFRSWLTSLKILVHFSFYESQSLSQIVLICSLDTIDSVHNSVIEHYITNLSNCNRYTIYNTTHLFYLTSICFYKKNVCS